MEYWDFFYVDRIFVLIFRVGVKFCNVGVWSVCFGDEVVMVGEVEWKRDWGFQVLMEGGRGCYSYDCGVVVEGW